MWPTPIIVAGPVADSFTCIFEKDEFKKSDLETLRGRLIFAESQIFGRLAHKALKQIGADMSSPGKCHVSKPLREALVFLRDRVITSEAREILCCKRSVIHLYIDACREEHGSGVGGVLYDQTGKEVVNFGEFLMCQHGHTCIHHCQCYHSATSQCAVIGFTPNHCTVHPHFDLAARNGRAE